MDFLESRFRKVVEYIARLFPEGFSNTEFRRNHIFYTLFTAVFHCLFGLLNFTHDGRAVPRVDLLTEAEVENVRNGLDCVSELFKAEPGVLQGAAAQFLQDSRRATTDEAVRERRTRFVLGLMGKDIR